MADRRRIGIVLPSLQFGGTEVATLLLVEGLLETYEVTLALAQGGPVQHRLLPHVRRRVDLEMIRVVAPGEPRKAESGSASHPVGTVVRDLVRRTGAESTIRNLVRQVSWRSAVHRAKEDLPLLAAADLVHVVNGGHPGSSSARAWAAVLARDVRARPSVLTVHGEAQPRRLVRRMDRAMDNEVFSADAVVVLGDCLARSIRERRGAPEQRIVVIPNGIPDPPTLDPAEARHALGAPPAAPIVAAVGRLSREKGTDLLLEAFAEVVRRVPGALLFLAGDGPEVDALARTVDRMGLGGSVRILGFVDVGPVYAACDVVVLPSRAEGMPLVVMEAMARARPVVATRVGAVEEMIEEGVEGLLVDATPPALARALWTVLDDRPRSAAMGQEGRRTYLERFSIDRMVSSYVDLYEDLLQRAKSRDRA